MCATLRHHTHVATGALAMIGLIVSTLVFFVASFYLKRYFEAQDLPAGLTRNVLVFTLALAVAYGADAVVSRLIA
jgi:hypothetical protein